MVYSYTDLTTNQTVSGTVALTGNGDTLTGKIQLPYYKNVKDGTTYPLTIVEKNAEVNGYRLVISGSTAMSNLNQDDDSFTYSISATTKSEINRTVTNTYSSIEPETADWDKLTVEKSAAPSGAVKPGDTVTYTISVSNGTGKDLKGIEVSEKLKIWNLSVHRQPSMIK